MGRVVFSPDISLVACPLGTSGVRLYDVKSQKVVAELTHDNIPAKIATFSPYGDSLAIGLRNGKVALWKIS